MLAGPWLRAAVSDQPLTSEQILQKVTFPPEFTATVFASPPAVSYPIFLSAAADGTLFIGCDQNGSLGREPNRGRVIRARDTDGDGRADQFTTFATMDSPRGVAWDQSTRTLYVMHPPDLTAYHDDNDTGVANRQETLITGLGFGLDFRGADHTTNGIRLGIDGWIYIAVGDYGAVKATGKDGRTLALRGGGIVRVRPDGTGMELAVAGTRNILAVAVSPTLDLFTRDNTNDGDDWNVRLSHVPLGAQMGYPTLFRNFADEIMPPMVDYGGGSPVGSIFIDEPALPKAWAQGFYSVEWGKSEISLHPLTAAGASWKADAIPFMKMTRANDLEVDGAGRLYAASWDGATFNFAGPNVGYLIRLVGKDAKPIAVPDFAHLTAPQLVAHIGSGSAVWRLAAQRELLKRGASTATIDGLRGIAEGHALLAARVAAIFTLKLLQGAKSHAILTALTKQEAVREFALKALADDPTLARSVAADPFVGALADPSPRVRLQAVTGLGRLGKIETAPALLKRTADPDPTVAHIAVQALRTLGAADACFAALDDGDDAVQRGALRVLQSLYVPTVIDGLLRRLQTATGSRRLGIFSTLARLNTKEATYTEPKMWWGTRPDTSGPIYKPERWLESDRIETALKQQLGTATGEEARQFVNVLIRTKVNFPGLTELMLARAGDNAAARLDLIAPLISPKAPLPDNLLALLRTIAADPAESGDLRARALRLLISAADKNLDVVVEALAPLARDDGPAPLTAAWEEFTRDARHARRVNAFAGLARDSSPSKRIVGATVLLNLVTSPVVKDAAAKRNARTAIDGLWKNPAQAVTLLEAIGRTRAATFAPQVKAHLNDPNSGVVAAAQATIVRLEAGTDGSAGSKPIGELPFAEVVRTVLATKGDPKRGQELFLQRACFACHTVSPHEPPKGPMLGGIAQRYSRAELAESILQPNAKIAQGFESQHFKLRNGTELDGFVVREGGDSVDVRNVAGVTTMIEKGDIAQREKRETSIMPEGLLSGASVSDLASLLAYLESTTSK